MTIFLTVGNEYRELRLPRAQINRLMSGTIRSRTRAWTKLYQWAARKGTRTGVTYEQN